jgi:hypothetical protein
MRVQKNPVVGYNAAFGLPKSTEKDRFPQENTGFPRVSLVFA